MPSPLLEAAYLIQAFVAAIEALQVTSLFYYPYGYVHDIYTYMYLRSPPSISPTNTHPAFTASPLS
jgi:hypothetical protein